VPIVHAQSIRLGDAADFRQLFYEGCTGSDGKTYNAVVIGAKGDLKWFTKIALQRSYENQGRIAAYACCHECMAGQPGVPWEELASDRPAWSLTRYAQRPWTDIPCTVQIPYCPQIPEKQFKRDPFHTLKLGVYRDIAGSILCFLVAKGYFGTVGDFDSKLKNAHMGFTLYCRTVGKSPALRTFSRRLFMLPRLDKYPWSNTKGSDTMILIDWLTVALAGFENVPLDNSHLPTFRLMKATCKAARKVFTDLNEHGLWAMRPCSMVFYSNMQGLIRGYCALASVLLNDEFNGFAIKPKLHLLRHTTLEIDEALQQGAGLETERFEALRSQVKRPLYGCDCYAYGLCASGFGADLVVEADLGIYDYMALVPVVINAGGCMSDWQGQPLTLQSHEVSKGRVVAAATPELWEAAVKVLSTSGSRWKSCAPSWPSVVLGAILGASLALMASRK
ncbi:unnamed protein product, partial [Cladocopium goreaui]